MQCSNDSCKYSDPEHSFFCCPRCGEIIQPYLAALDDKQEVEAYIKITAFQDYLQRTRLLQRFLVFSVYVLIGLELLFSFLASQGPEGPTSPNFADASIPIWNSCILRQGVTLTLLYYFFSHYEDVALFRKVFGAQLWKVHIKENKKFILLAFAFVVVMIAVVEIPSFYTWSSYRFQRIGGGPLFPLIQTTFYGIYLAWVVINVLYYHLDDLKRLTMCEAMRAW